MPTLLSLIAILLSVLLTFSCSKNPTPKGFTKITFSKGKVTVDGSRVQDNGVVLVGKSDEGQSFFISGYDSSDSTIEMTLPNGSWDFVGIGWETVTAEKKSSSYGKMTGYARCSTVSSATLDGTDKSVTMNMSVDKCSDESYGPSDYYCSNYGFKPLRVVTCRISTTLPTDAEEDCMSNLGSIRSIRVMMPTLLDPPLTSSSYGQFEDWNNSGSLPSFMTDSFQSECREISDSVSYVDTRIRVPLGDHITASDFVFDPVVMAYTDASCGASINNSTYTSYMLIDGVDGYNTNGPLLVLEDATRVAAFLYDQDGQVAAGDEHETNIDVGACAGSTWTSYTDEGSGTEADPYQLCTMAQIQSIEQVSARNSFYDGTTPVYFKMLGDINMTSYSGIIGSSTSQFKGNFDGGGFQLHNINFSTETTSYVGLFGYVEGHYGHSDTGTIKNIHLVNPQISISYKSKSDRPSGYIGGLVGYVNDYSEIIHSGVIGSSKGPKTASITASFSDNVGGLIGYVNYNVKIEDVESINLIVNGQNQVGGVIGGYYGLPCGTITGAKIIDAVNVTVNGTNHLGGIIGEFSAYGDFIIDDSLAENVTINGTSYLGGLIGTIYDSTPQNIIQNTYATGTVNATGSNAGGLIGYIGGAKKNHDKEIVVRDPLVYISNSFAAVTVGGAGSSNKNAFIGYYSSSATSLSETGITDCFWDSDLTSETTALQTSNLQLNGESGYIIGLSTSILQNETTFKTDYAQDWNWTDDSTTMWNYDGGNSSYPTLK